jgi:dihydropteroate synthase
MQRDPRYADVVAEVCAALAARMAAAQQAGIAREAILIDPGIGFGKTARHNMDLLAALPRLAALAPVLAGVSRKRLIGDLTGQPVGARLAGSVAAALWCAAHGAALVRVHDVRETRDALRVWQALAANGANGAPEAGAS